MRLIAMLAVLFCSLSSTPESLWAAPRWCAANYSDAIFCEDWDWYCVNPPADPNEACPVGSQKLYWNIPYQTGIYGCTGLSMEEFWVTSNPFSGRANSSGDLGNTKMNLPSYIRAKFGQTYSRVMATDTKPIIMEYVLDGPPQAAKAAARNAYMELANGVEQPLTDYILSDDCAACGCVANQCTFPLICRQSPAPHSSSFSCPPVATAPILPSIAVGALAYLDVNPCHCDETRDHFPSNTQLNFFDGKQWWILSNSLVPSTFPGSGNFRMYPRMTENSTWTEPGANHIRLTIMPTTVKVELNAKNPDTNLLEHSMCVIPRQYLGPFTLVNFGYAQPCRLKTNGTWECAGVRQCVTGAPAGATTTFDNMVVAGGIGYDDPGACCITDQIANPPSITCVQANGALDCDDTYGGQFKGAGTNCTTTPCCPPFLPDHDMDGDVDLEDFGWFQTCLSSASFENPPTVPCRCANLDGNTGDIDVDAADFVIFADCLSGPGIPADYGCIN